MRKGGHLEEAKRQRLCPPGDAGDAEVEELDDEEHLAEAVRSTSVEDAGFEKVWEEVGGVLHEKFNAVQGEDEAGA